MIETVKNLLAAIDSDRVESQTLVKAYLARIAASSHNAFISVNDLHATILHLAGIDHERLTYRYSGRDFRLTDVAGNVVKSVVS